MSKLFEPSEINGLVVPNRFVRSATWEGMADPKGFVTPVLSDLMVALAEGEVGSIITGHAYVRAEGQGGIGQLGIDRDETVPGLRRMVGAVHDAGGKTVVQLNHCGLRAEPERTRLPALAPSTDVAYFANSRCEELTEKQIFRGGRPTGCRSNGGLHIHVPTLYTPAGSRRCWRLGDRRRARCESDSLCFPPIHAGEGVRCEWERIQSKR